jgi:hypothetical protein
MGKAAFLAASLALVATPSAAGRIAAAAPASTSPPTVSGTPAEGQRLAGNRGTWTGTRPFTFAYRWLRCDAGGGACSAIAGATGGAYRLTAGDVGRTVEFEVTATNAQGTTVATSTATPTIERSAPVDASLPGVDGTPQAAERLTARHGAWNGTATIAFAYQWLRCDPAGGSCAPVAGATDRTYLLAPTDVGATFAVEVTATNDLGSASATSAPTAPVVDGAAPVLVSAPSVSGTAEDGQRLLADRGAWSTWPTYAYQWLRCDSADGSCSPIAGATNRGYTLRSADVGSTLAVEVTATNAYGSSAAASAPTPVVAATAPANVAAPAIAGLPELGQALTGDRGRWSGTAPLTFAWQWLRCDPAGCVEIPGATRRTYTTAVADLGGRLELEVTATNALGSASATSDPTAVVGGPVG